jgi:hypothetical protein
MFSDYKFHPSSLGLIMTESRTKEELGETAKAHLMECYVSKKYGRRKDVTNAYIEKGLVAEEDSLDLYTLVKDQLFVKNKETLNNSYFIGTPDILVLDKPPFEKVLEVIDLKTSWDIFTFFSIIHKPMNKNYYWQLQSYMDLTGAQKAKLVYCLVNTPFKLIEDQKRKLMWTMAVIDPDTDEAYQKACDMVDKNSIYDDIPMEERYIEFELDRDQEAIDKAHARVEFCRNFLNQL